VSQIPTPISIVLCCDAADAASAAWCVRVGKNTSAADVLFFAWNRFSCLFLRFRIRLSDCVELGRHEILVNWIKRENICSGINRLPLGVADVQRLKKSLFICRYHSASLQTSAVALGVTLCYVVTR
jgi:hypothetical protein